MNRVEELEILEDTEKFYKIIGQNVKKYRQKAHFSQLDFANEIGIKSVSFYCDCENNKNGKHFNLLHIVRISKILNISTDNLLKL